MPLLALKSSCSSVILSASNAVQPTPTAIRPVSSPKRCPAAARAARENRPKRTWLSAAGSQLFNGKGRARIYLSRVLKRRRSEAGGGWGGIMSHNGNVGAPACVWHREPRGVWLVPAVAVRCGDHWLGGLACRAPRWPARTARRPAAGRRLRRSGAGPYRPRVVGQRTGGKEGEGVSGRGGAQLKTTARSVRGHVFEARNVKTAAFGAFRVCKE